jgi:hypothetical protein
MVFRSWGFSDIHAQAVQVDHGDDPKYIKSPREHDPLVQGSIVHYIVDTTQ